MNHDELRKMIASAEESEKDALHNLGVVRGYREALRDVLLKLEEGRKVVEVAGNPVVTTARDPRPEKR